MNLWVFLAAACGSGAHATSDESLHFLVMGDWGGLPAPVYKTPAEEDTARAMGEEATKQNSSFSLALGDNFYETGITTDEHDGRFKHTFEDVFKSASLKGDGFFRVLAGNHDHKGNVTAQIAYSGISNRWSFPSLYYTFTEAVDANGTTAQFLMIDTVTLSGASADPLTGEELPGSNYVLEDPVAAAAQMAWINTTLAESTADYVFVSGHYPVWSVCEHGPTSHLVDELKPVLELHNVTAYFSGHDHCEEHIADPSGVQYHVVGAANQNGGSHKHKDAVPSDWIKFLDIGTFPLSVLTGGFASVEITEQGAEIKHFRSKSDGYKLMYTAEPILPREIAH